jgi:hypothetical protein
VVWGAAAFTKIAKQGIERPAVVPRYDQLPVFIIKHVLRTARISRERYLEVLNQV